MSTKQIKVDRRRSVVQGVPAPRPSSHRSSLARLGHVGGSLSHKRARRHLHALNECDDAVTLAAYVATHQDDRSASSISGKSPRDWLDESSIELRFRSQPTPRRPLQPATTAPSQRPHR